MKNEATSHSADLRVSHLRWWWTERSSHQCITTSHSMSTTFPAWYCCVVLFLFFLFSIPTATMAGAKENLLLIGWDGVQYNHLQEMLSAGELPNLSRFPVLVRTEITDHATSTKPGWVQILTGLEASVSGTRSNGIYRPFPQRACLFDILKKDAPGRNLWTAFVAGKDHHLGSMGPGVRWIDGDGKPTSSRDGEPWFHARKSFDLWMGDMDRDADEVGTLAISLLDRFAKRNQFAVFVHFADPDCKGHRFGENSPEYSQAVSDCDAWLGRILGKLDELGVAGKTLVAVVTDHGFDEGEFRHHRSYDAWLAVRTHRNPRWHDGDQKDVAPTLLRIMGSGTEGMTGKPLWW